MKNITIFNDEVNGSPRWMEWIPTTFFHIGEIVEYNSIPREGIMGRKLRLRVG